MNVFISILKINDSLPNFEKDFMCINVLSIHQELQVGRVGVVKFPLERLGHCKVVVGF